MKTLLTYLALCSLLVAPCFSQVAISWADIDKGNSSLADLATRSFADLQNKPTTLAGYGITDPIVLTSGTYADPAWLTSLAATKLTGTVPTARLYTTAVGYNIANGAALDALAAVATNGLLTRTAANTYVARTLTGTAGQIAVQYGDGVSGNPTISLPTALTGINAITSVALSNLVLATGTFGTSVTFASATGIPTFATHVVIEGVTSTGATGSGNFVFHTAPTFSGIATSAGGFRISNGKQFNLTGSSTALTLADGSSGGTMMVWNGGSASTGFVSIPSTLASTSTTTGSLTVGGGVGVTGAQFLGGDLTFGTSASVLSGTTNSIGLTAVGANQTITFTPSGTGGVAFANGLVYGKFSSPFFFGLTGAAIGTNQIGYITSGRTDNNGGIILAGAGQTYGGASGSTIQLFGINWDGSTTGAPVIIGTAGTVGSNANNYISFTTVGVEAARFTPAGKLTINTTTEATTSTGALDVAGGILSRKKLITLSTITTAANVAWDLGAYTAGAPTPDGYLTVIVAGSTYRVSADLQ